jgi:pyruvate dehydrogenase E1 component alpha subunit
VLFCCENNLYAMGTALERSEAVTDLSMRAAGYGMPAWPVDGMDVLAVADAARRAVVQVRDGGGPLFLELRTYRFRAHSMYDPERYRSKDEVELWRRRDPITLLTERLRDGGVLTDDDLAAMEDEVVAELDAAVAGARAGTLEPVEDLTRFVTSEVTA